MDSRNQKYTAQDNGKGLESMSMKPRPQPLALPTLERRYWEQLPLLLWDRMDG